MKQLFATVSGGALACALAISPALAQQQPSTSQGGQQGESQVAGSAHGGGQAGDLTCAHLNYIDAAEIPGLLYFVHGFSEAQSTAGERAEPGAGAEMAADQGAGPATPGIQAEADRTAAADQGAQPQGAQPQGAQPQGAQQQAGAAADAGPAAEGEAPGAESPAQTMTAEGEGGAGLQPGGDPSAGEGMQPVAIAGFFRIPIEQTVVLCAENPDSTIADVIRQQQGSAGAESRGG